jgi:hypothetical protein
LERIFFSPDLCVKIISYQKHLKNENTKPSEISQKMEETPQGNNHPGNTLIKKLRNKIKK